MSLAPRSPSPETGKDAVLTEANFKAIAERVYQLTGIVLKEHKRQMVHTRLSRRLRALGLTDFDSYLRLLDSPESAAEIGELMNAITTNLTSFFRESHHFDHLRSEVIEPCMAKGASRFRIWSAGCSTGEEPYTIQMTMQAAGGLAHRWDYRLLATDLDSNVLARAAAGVYAADRVTGVPPAVLSAAASQRPDGTLEMRPVLKAPIRFRQLNLLHQWPVKGPFDAIFCRNVLIYFDTETKLGIVDRFADLLAPHGALYLGHSESLLGEHPKLLSC
ncbi:protein-glutamate O-methyltransferase CheR [Oceanicella sp. SM1341]|uniref:CheR family methyltransferase n=1 Tax=Oceanicella sp. SM1341 TaxID=1548889 RepID=UPI000E514FCE|nr:protein-glutamate O-methyltransferase CheR [Oceanicella sp. SM1341]